MASFQGVTNSTYAPTATNRGTQIVKPGNDMDKNAFLRILTAELANQDPSNPQDSTQYVAQMAQFSSLEQMSNLNSTMSFMGASSIVGKYVGLNVADDMGNPYAGTVTDVYKEGDTIKMGVQVDVDGKKQIKEFSYSDIASINSNTSSNDSTNFLLASSLIGKSVDFSETDGDTTTDYSGIVKGVIKDAAGIKLNVEVTNGDSSSQSKKVPLDWLTGVSTS